MEDGIASACAVAHLDSLRKGHGERADTQDDSAWDCNHGGYTF
jgi:hypothetical protein